MRALLFSGLTLLVGAPAGWLVTQDAPRGQQALAPNQTAATGLSDDNQSPAPQPPTARRPTQPPMVPQDGALPLNVSGNAAVGGAGPVMGFPLRGAATASGTDNRVFGFRLPGTRAANNDPNEIKARQLAAKVRATDDESARKAMLAELQALTDESFETMMRSRREQLAKAGQRLDELVERLEERQQLKSEIVKRRVAELLDQPDPLSWETPTVSFAVEPPARFPTPTRGNAADPFAPNPYVQARAGGSGSFGGGSGGGTFGGGGAGGSDPFGGGS